jgi:3D (Asp-Asp-Asp) domain-containing protein
MGAMRTDRLAQRVCGAGPLVAPLVLLVVLALAVLTMSACAQAEGQSRQDQRTPGAAGTSGTVAALENGEPVTFSVTAYCTGTVTKSGARVRPGMAAADPRILPLGSTVQVEGQGPAYDGIYTVMDTGSAVKGRILDLYVNDCSEAKEFGRREMTVTVIRRGWDPSATPTPVGTSGEQ